MSRSDSLVSVGWTLEHLDAPDVVVVEVDEDASAYARGHVPGAVAFDWRHDLQDPLRRDVVDREAFGALMGSRGIARDDTVVLYGGNGNWFAAYAFWYLRLYGHRSVKLMDGGRKKWQLDGHPLTAEPTVRPATTYVADGPDTSLRAYRDEVLAAIGVENLVDVRSPGEFEGRLLAPAHLPQERSQRPGHIPTAVNVPWSRAVHEDGTFRSDAELADLYAQAGVDPARGTITYCRIGERASHTWFVLHELLGMQRVRTYDGSWTEYGSLVGVPVERTS